MEKLSDSYDAIKALNSSCFMLVLLFKVVWSGDKVLAT